MSNRPSQLSERERANLRRAADYSSVNSLPEIWHLAANRFGDIVALHDPHSDPEVVLTYTQLNQRIRQFASGLQALGLQPGSHVALFADNSPRWIIADQGMIMAGAANAVRSSQAETQELIYILRDSNSTCLVVENLQTLNRISSSLVDLPIELIVLLSDEQAHIDEPIKIVNFPELIAAGINHTFKPVKQTKDTLATLIYTSGTTGQPKGVMLSHGNLLHQITTFSSVLVLNPGDRVLSILPTWHSYERTGEYFILSQGCTQLYSNLRSIKKDLKQFQPNFLFAVPRLLESIYEGVNKQLRSQPMQKQQLANFFFQVSERYIQEHRIAQNLSLEHPQPSLLRRLIAKLVATGLFPVHALGKKLVYSKIREATGGNINAIISGGGSLAKHLDNFYEIIGVNVLVGYGLTETSPVTNVRRPWHNLRGASGQPIAGTQIRIVDPQTRQSLPNLARGLVLIRGPQVMQGYYNKPEATTKAIDEQGWFDSGDLGYLTLSNALVLTGRAKDTIVLSNGENIEPQPIEDACLRSPFVDQIMLVGQDQKGLGALIVPNFEALKQWAQAQDLDLELSDGSLDLQVPQVQNLFRQELNREVKNRPGYRADDRIGPFELIVEPFSQENGMMTQTLKIKRPIVREHYRDIIDGMFRDR